MDRFEEMRTFITVVKQGSLTAAADKLDIAKSAISRRLADLEERLGVQLLNRTTRKINLTESGQQYYQHCLHILTDLEEAELSVSSEHAQLKGTIRIAAPLSFGVKHLSPLMNQFLLQHQGLTLDLDFNDSMVNIIEEGVDLALRIGQLADSSYKARRLAPIKRIICASPEYLEEHGTPETAADLKHHLKLSYSNVSDAQLWQFTEPDGSQTTIHAEYRMKANNGDMLLKAAIDGLGITTMPTFISYKAIQQGLLIPILTDYQLSEIALYAVYPDQRHLPQRVRVFIDYLAEQFGNKPYWDNI